MAPRTLAALLLLLSCAAAHALQSVSGNFSVEPPKGWVVNPPGGFGVKESIFLEPDAGREFRGNIVFIEEPLRKGDTLEEAARESVRFMGKAFRKFKVISQSSLRSASGLEITKIVYERELRPDKPLLLHVCYLTVVRNQSLLSVTVTGTQGDTPTPKAAFEQAEAAVLSLKSN